MREDGGRQLLRSDFLNSFRQGPLIFSCQISHFCNDLKVQIMGCSKNGAKCETSEATLLRRVGAGSRIRPPVEGRLRRSSAKPCQVLRCQGEPACSCRLRSFAACCKRQKLEFLGPAASRSETDRHSMCTHTHTQSLTHCPQPLSHPPTHPRTHSLTHSPTVNIGSREMDRLTCIGLMLPAASVGEPMVRTLPKKTA